MGPRSLNDAEAVKQQLAGKRKFADLHRATIDDIVDQEYRRHPAGRPAFDAARKRLHRIRADYLGPMPSKALLAQVHTAIDQKDTERVQQLCRQILTEHHSMKERLPFIEDFYSTLWQLCGRPESIHDLACAMHPFAWPWMGLSNGVQYFAYDNVRGHVDTVAAYLEAEAVAATVEWRDILVDPPSNETDVALFFKMYHCLEDRRSGAGRALLEAIPAKKVAIALPTQTLAGRARNIADRHRPAIEALATEREWPVAIADFPNEQLIVVSKTPAG
ncbi:MAG: hypothetical protein AAFN74_17295 [Myxococcota bacterium]